MKNLLTHTVSCGSITPVPVNVDVLDGSKLPIVELKAFNGVLYDSGNEYESITGGWKHGSYNYRTAPKGTFSKTSSRLVASGSDCCIVTTKTVPIKGYTKLCCISKCTSGGIQQNFVAFNSNTDDAVYNSPSKIVLIESNELFTNQFINIPSQVASYDNVQIAIQSHPGTLEYEKIWLE